MSDNDNELDASKLGTLEYWDEAYEKEIENFNEHGDEGEIWFGAQSVKRVLNWLKAKNFEKNLEIIDIGCGNGYTCCKLADDGYSNLTGVDYSQNAIDLAKAISTKKNLKINYEVMDVLARDQLPTKKFDIAIDKGTYDAIALSPIDPKTKRLQYKEFLCNILKDQGLFIITSCNWTSAELTQFYTESKEFEQIDEIKAPASFSFGGASGSTTSTLVFKHIKHHV